MNVDAVVEQQAREIDAAIAQSMYYLCWRFSFGGEDGRVACLVADGKLVPIIVPLDTLPMKPMPSWRDRAVSEDRDVAEHLLRAWQERPQYAREQQLFGELTFRPARTILPDLHGNLARCLAFRSAGFRLWKELRRRAADPLERLRQWLKPSNTRSHHGGLHVRVHTQRRRLRVLATFAYACDWRYFGYPTTPARGALSPATYLFATDNYPEAPAWRMDPVKFDIPPSVEPEVMAF